MMAATNYQDLQQTLLEEKQRLESLLDRTGKHLYRREEPIDADFAEQAVETQNNEVVEQIDQDAHTHLHQINQALHRMENDQFGWCTQCGKAIGEARLHAIPFTEFCIDCADKNP